MMSVRQNSNSCHTTAFSSCCCWNLMPPNMSWRPSTSRHSLPSGETSITSEGSPPARELCTVCRLEKDQLVLILGCFNCFCLYMIALYFGLTFPFHLQQYLPHPEAHQSPGLCLRLAGTHLPSHLHRQDASTHTAAEGLQE